MEMRIVMNQAERDQLIADLQNTRQQISVLLLTVADDQDWQPDVKSWSFRYIAAHMAACEEECYLPRIQQIASGENPHFEFYDNTWRDFSACDLRASLDDWAAARQEVINFFRALPDDKLSLTGVHQTYGSITVTDYLGIGLDHDRGHLHDLEEMLAAYRQRRQTI
jgi:hypothetical protein